MYAVINAGGRQHLVREGDTIQVGRLSGNEGDEIKFTPAMIRGEKTTFFGTPVAPSKGEVTCVISKHTRSPKIVVFKFKRRKNYKKKQGHKQQITFLKVLKINNPGDKK